MSSTRLLLIFALAGSCILPATILSAPRTRENTEWDTAYGYNANDHQLPRVLLLGDSICNGYQAHVRDELAGIAYVSFWATSKCVSDPSYLKQLGIILGEYEYSVVHFNNGLHSLKTEPSEWETGLRNALGAIRQNCPTAKIVWVSSTPLKDPDLTLKAMELNSIGGRIAASEKLPVNDLFSLMNPLDRNQFWTDTYHFSAEAKKRQAHQVSETVRKLLGAGTVSAVQAAAALESAGSKTGPSGAIDTGPIK